MNSIPVNQDIIDCDIRWTIGIRNDSASDFESMYRHYYERLCQFAFRFVNNQATAEDMVHNVFLNIWKNRTSWNPRGTLRTYLYRSVKNQSLKHLAHRKVQNRSMLDDLTILPDQNRMNPEKRYWNEEFKAAVQKAVQELPEKRRIIWLMHREDKLTYQEIADVLGLSVKTVETQMSRSLKFIRAELAEFLPFIAAIMTMIHWH